MRSRDTLKFRGRRGALTLFLLCGGPSHIVGCTCNDDHPYTPFEVASTLGSGGTSTDSAAPVAEAKPSSNVIMAVAARGQTEWRVFNRSVKAPPGLGFERGFLFEAEGAPLFWLTPLEAPAEPGRAGLFEWQPDGGLALRFALPDFLPEGPDCATLTAATASGRATLVIQARVTCQTKRLAGTPMGAVTFVDAHSKQPVFGVRFLDSSPGEHLQVSGLADDQDGDGLDDREVTVELRSPQGVTVSAGFRWLSRPAGPSRRTENPAQEFMERADRLTIAALRKKEREAVPAEVDAWRRLFGSLCAESTTGRITLLSGEALRCGSLDRALASFTHSSITAKVALLQHTAALGEFQRSDWFGSGLDQRQAPALAKLLLEKIPQGKSEVASTVALDQGADGWLGWDRAGRLWLHDATSETAIWPKDSTHEGEPDEPGAVPRVRTPDPRVGPGGRRLSQVLPSCDRSEVQVLLQTPGENAPLKALPILAPRPAACDQFGRPPLKGWVVQFRGAEADLLIEGEPLSENGGAFVPRAPLGWHTKLGLAVLGKNGLSLASTGRAILEHNCAVDEAEKMAACVHERTVTVYRLEPPTRSAP